MFYLIESLSVTSWTLITGFLALARFYSHLKWRFLQKYQIPHDPPSVFKIGHMRDFQSKQSAFEYDNQQKKKYGPIWGCYLGTAPIITIHDPDILRQIFINQFKNFPVRRNRMTKTSGKELNTSLSNVCGGRWKRLRSTMTPAFSVSKLKQITGAVERCADVALEVLSSKVKDQDGIFNSKELFSRLALDIACATALSAKVYSQNGVTTETEIVKQARKLYKGSLFSPLIFLAILFPPVEKLVEILGVPLVGGIEPVRYFKKLTFRAIAQRQNNPPHKKPTDLLQMLLKSEIPEGKEVEKGMTKTEIAGNLMMMIMQEYENTGNAMSFLAYNLAQHPDIQARVQEEIKDMVKAHGEFHYVGVSSLKLLDMCLNETLRLYSPTLRNSRICKNEVTINGLTIPKGVKVSIPVYALAHDPEFWEDPFEFKPERMQDMSRINPMVFQPFGAGPRNCIGTKLALMEIKVSMAKILHRYRITTTSATPKPPLKLQYGLVVRPLVDYELRVVPISDN